MWPLWLQDCWRSRAFQLAFWDGWMDEWEETTIPIKSFDSCFRVSLGQIF